MKVSFYNIGCKVNFAEMSSISDMFAEQNWEVVEFGQPADLTLINTCTVTSRADADCRKIVRRAKRYSPQAYIGVMGCYAQLGSSELMKIEGVDGIFGLEDKFHLAEIISRLLEEHSGGKGTQVIVSSLDSPEFHYASSVDNESHTRAALKIQDGCDYKCSYCTVPLARGGGRSMDFDGLMPRLESIANSGYREFVLSGINLGEYKSPTGENLTDALRKFVDSGLNLRCRISSIEPNLLNNEIIALTARSDMICPHFHIPLQSGSNEILRLMRRRYNAEYFRDLILRLKEQIPDCCIGIDLIAGFPGESDSHFEETYKLLESLPFSYLHAFTYSERKNTPAATFGGAVPQHIRKRRTAILRSLSESKKIEFYRSQLGSLRTVIPETFADDGSCSVGWTENYIRTKVIGAAPFESRPVRVKIDALEGEIASASFISVI